MKYKYDILTAQDDGEMRHPETVIREHAPNATELTPESVFDCWTFESDPIDSPPAFITEFK